MRRPAVFRALRGLLVAPFAVAPFTGVFADEPLRIEQEVKPQVVLERGGKLEDPVGALRQTFEKAPVPKWIWGAEDKKDYELSVSIPGGSAKALLQASCDNAVVLFINGVEIGRSTEWREPVEVDLQSFLKESTNTLVAKVHNTEGIAAFVARIVLQMPDGSTKFLVTGEDWKLADGGAVTVKNAYGAGPWGNVFANAGTGQRNVFNVLPGFEVEQLFLVPKDQMGSWVSITFDDKGRLIASDEGKHGLFRVSIPPVGSGESTVVEKLPANLSGAQGLLSAFGALYVTVNSQGQPGLYRVTDGDNDDRPEKVEQLATYKGSGEHGPHAIRLSPDGKSIYAIFGNHTAAPKTLDDSCLPTNWGEDHLLPRMWDANGHARGIMAPGGYIAETDRDGKTWKMFSIGYRNPYDMAFNADGELFAYDADMEWDMGSPWYRPTRVNHASNGAELGWRSGTGKWPAYYPDSLPAMVDIGPGSPVGVEFGYGTKFPSKYQQALYICDWTFGTMYAIHIQPNGSTYSAKKEEFVSRTPLPLTDVAVGPDGNLYFTMGGRGTQSGLFRVIYRGKEPTAPVNAKNAAGTQERALRHKLETYHSIHATPSAAVVNEAWPHLANADRFIRYAARIAIEMQPVDSWEAKLDRETNPLAIIHGAIALARQGDKSKQERVLRNLDRLTFQQLSIDLQLDLLRAYGLTFIRQGEPSEVVATTLSKKLEPFYPSNNDALNRELCQMLVYLKSPKVIEATLQLLAQPDRPSDAQLQELLARNPGFGGSINEMLKNQPDLQKGYYIFVLRNLKTGWTLAQRKQYFDYLKVASTKNGGASYRGFIRNIDNEAFENASEAERLAIESSGARQPYKIPELPKAEGPGKKWTVADVVAAAEGKMKKRDFKNGAKMFAAARCVVCHRFAGDGGATGPDLTQAAGRFSLKDLTEAIVEPSKVISDQYRAHVVVTDDGVSRSGRIVSENEKSITMLTNPEDPTKVVAIERSTIDEMTPSQTSIMPAELLDSLNENEVLDLLAYVLSRGNPGDGMFR